MNIGDYCTINELAQGSVFEYQNFKYIKISDHDKCNAIDGTFKLFEFDNFDRLKYCGRAGIVELMN